MPVAVPVVLAMVGFGQAGVIAGSAAAGYQATLGGVVTAGSWFAAAQSVGAAGMGTAGVVAASAAGGVAGGAVGYSLGAVGDAVSSATSAVGDAVSSANSAVGAAARLGLAYFYQ